MYAPLAKHKLVVVEIRPQHCACLQLAVKFNWNYRLLPPDDGQLSFLRNAAILAMATIPKTELKKTVQSLAPPAVKPSKVILII